MLFKNLERINKEDKELEELEEQYRKENDPEYKAKENEENKNEKEPEVVTKDDETWKKRYSDLRSHSSKKENELSKEVADLKKKLETVEKNPDLPKNKEEAKEWVSKYPDLARVLMTLMEERDEKIKEEVDNVRNEITLERAELAREKAFSAVLKVHPDFVELINDKKFQEWVNDQPKKRGSVIGGAIFKALYENETDADAAIEAVNVYKADVGKKPSDKKEVVDAAKTVKKSAPETPRSDGKKVWLESEIDKMDRWTFDRLEEELEVARREGRIEYDISGAAR